MKNCYVIILLTTLCLSCTQTTGFSNRETGIIAGTIVGAGLGAVIGHGTGHTGEGIAIGAGTGAIAGGLYGNQQDILDSRYDEQNERLRIQEEDIYYQRKELEELRRKNQDDSFDRRNDKSSSYRYRNGTY